MQKLTLVLLAVVLFVQCRQQKTTPPKQASPKKTAPAKVSAVSASYDSFGIDVSDYKVRDFSVKKNESLYILLQKLNLDQAQIYRAIQKAKNIIDVRSFRPKQTYRAYLSKDDNKLEKVVWEPNQVEFVTFDWQPDSLQISRASRVVRKREKTISGTINSSLYNAISDADARDEMVYKISDILAWRVNFFHLQKGDSFNILYEKKYVDGDFYDIGKILAIKLTNMGDTYYAYWFSNSEVEGYYDEEGKSVKRALLKTPFKYDQRISSRFNMHRFHPILHRNMPHTGVDFAAPYGTRVLAVGSGTVLEAHYGGAAGKIIKIKHNRTYTTAYMHLSKYAHGIHRGVHVKQGQVIGYVGNTGRVTGTHLHYSLYKNGHPINPFKVDLPASKALPDKYMDEFETVRKSLNNSMLLKGKADSVEAISKAVNTVAIQ